MPFASSLKRVSIWYRAIISLARVAGLIDFCTRINPRTADFRFTLSRANDLRCRPADQNKSEQDFPAIFVAIRLDWKMTANHKKNNRNSHKRVVLGAKFGLRAQFRVKQGPLCRRGDHLPLCRQNPLPYVESHDGSEQCSDMKVRGARAEDMQQSPRDSCGHEESKHREASFGLAENRAHRQIVNPPSADQDCDPNRNPPALRNLGDIGIDEPGASVIDECQQYHSAQPRQHRFPPKPAHQLGADAQRLLLFHRVKTAAVHHPHCRWFPVRCALLGFVELPVQPSEIVGLPDPQNSCKNVEPAHSEVEPLTDSGAQALSSVADSFIRSAPPVRRIPMRAQ